MARVFCAPPQHYNVIWGDNAHQHQGHGHFARDPETARKRLLRAWYDVAEEIARAGHELVLPKLSPDTPDQVFTADSVVHFIGKNGKPGALLSSMNSPDRQREVAAAEQAFRNRGYEIHEAHPSRKREGTGDCLYAADLGFYFMGYGPRSDAEAGQHFADVTGTMVVGVPLVDKPLTYNGSAGMGAVMLGTTTSSLASVDTEGFHLDVLAQPLPTGHLICYYDGLTAPTRAVFDHFYRSVFNEKTRAWDARMIEISAQDFRSFATNSLAVPDARAPNGYTMFVPHDISDELTTALEGHGYRLYAADIEVARWSGGGLHCMFNVENDLSAVPARPLHYVHEFVIDKWAELNAPENGRYGVRVFKPRPQPAAARFG